MALILTKEDIRTVLLMKENIEVLECAFRDVAAGRFTMPQRHIIRIEEEEGLAAFMPAHMPSFGALGIKIVTYFKNNPRRYDIPAIFGLVVLFEETTGRIQSLMEGGFLTAMRTGAATGVATQYLARQESSILGVLGSGVQALTQIAAVCEVRAIKEVKIYSPHFKAKQDQFFAQLKDFCRAHLTIDFKAVENAEEAVRDSDIVITATSASDPIIDGDWVAKGTHINAIGSHLPTMRELDTKTMVRSRVVCDSVEACLAEAGDIIIPIKEGKLKRENIRFGLGDVVLEMSHGRRSNEDITVFKSVGAAFEDVATAVHIYNKAISEGIGFNVDF